VDSRQRLADSTSNLRGETIMTRILRTACLFLFAFTALAALAASPVQFKVLHNFVGADGASPNALILAPDGFYYGSAAIGGDTNTCSPDGCGTLFKSDGAGHFTLLHVFHATDGNHPTGLVRGADGNFYGTALSGGQPSGGGGGTLFRINAAGIFAVLYRFAGGFACCDGAGPVGQLIQASDGNFYGATGGGGAFRDIEHQGGFGTIYRFNPASGAVTFLHSFNLPNGNGIYPNGSLVQASDGLLYGTTREGAGVFRDGGGTAFRIDIAGNFQLVAPLTGGAPLSGFIQASDGFFYGTQEGGGGGSVYRMDSSGNIKRLNAFDGADGWRPHFALLQTADGFLYGSAPEGGLLDFQGGDIYRIRTSGALRIVHSFQITGPDGFPPNSALIIGQDGALYGVTGIGGAQGHGTLFRFDQHIAGPIGSVTVNPALIPVGKTATGTVTLTSPAPQGGKVVTLGAKQGQIVIPTKVTVPAGARTATFTIKTLNILASARVRIYAYADGQGIRTVVTVQP
jgi:uncharacterized repeat protein (TIGR03803 family)